MFDTNWRLNQHTCTYTHLFHYILYCTVRVHTCTDKWLQPSFFLYKTETACIEFHVITNTSQNCTHAWRISVVLRMDNDFFFFGLNDILAIQFGGIFSAWRSNISLSVSVFLGTNWWKTCLLGCQSKMVSTYNDCLQTPRVDQALSIMNQTLHSMYHKMSLLFAEMIRCISKHEFKFESLC